VSGPQVRIVAGGSVDPQEEAAIAQAVLQVVRMRDVGGTARGSEWARAGRLEAAGRSMLRSRAELPPR
jgi:hypothetical protein